MVDTSKLYKIRYTINMLTTFSEHWRRSEDGTLLNLNAGHCMLEKALEADELGIFESTNFG